MLKWSNKDEIMKKQLQKFTEDMLR